VCWLAPDDDRALTCDDEFLLGDEVLIAPVVPPNTTQRDVYLPNGKWQDHWTKEIFNGAATLKNYSAPLDTLLIFKQIN
jgi:alpha-glucosidase